MIVPLTSTANGCTYVVQHAVIAIIQDTIIFHLNSQATMIDISNAILLQSN